MIGPSRRAQVEAAATMLAVATAVFAFTYDQGGYAVESRDLAGVLVWAALLFGVVSGVWPGRRLPPAAALVAGTALTALAALAALSALWTPSTERALDDACRTLLYAGVFVLVVLSASRGRRERWLDGLAIAIVAVVAVALISRFFPSVFGSKAVLRLSSGAPVWRLSFPIGYWNGLAIFSAPGIPLLLRAALAARHPLLRGLALVPLPAFAALIYLTSSRGGALAALAGIFVFFAVVPRRAATVVVLVVAGLAAAVAVAVVHDRPDIVNGPFTTAPARDQGHEAALWIAVVCCAGGLVYAGLAAAGSRLRLRAGRKIETALLAAGIVVVVVAAAAVHPVRRFDAFRRLPSIHAGRSAEAHLLSTSGSGRWQLWRSAVDEFRTRPLLGRGAGSYEAWQTQHGTLGQFAQDAHSMYLQTLGELGLVGCVLLLSFLGAGFAAGALALRGSEDEERLTITALLAALAAFSVGLAFDWMWQLPAVAVVGVVLLALLCSGTEPRTAPAASASWQLRVAGAALGLLAAAAVVALAFPFLSQREVDSSRAQAAGGDLAGAVRDAMRARAITPWNATPYVQVALVAEQGGNYAAARSWIREATKRDPSDWRLWVSAARIEAESGRVEEAGRSLARARLLNPRLPLGRE